jgi:SAM-dependent methyltransferase
MAAWNCLAIMVEAAHVGSQTNSLTVIPPGTIALAAADTPIYLSLCGFSGIEQMGRWSDGPRASATLLLPETLEKDILLKIRTGAFAGKRCVPYQIVRVDVNGQHLEQWSIEDPAVRTRAIFVRRESYGADRVVVINFDIPTCAQPLACGINEDTRFLGICLAGVSWEQADDKPSPESLVWQLGRYVGIESRKSFDDKIESGFWQRFVTGPKVLDIGFKGGGDYTSGVVPILDAAIGVDLGYPGYDGRTLPFETGTQDAVYSSHCLEHIPDFIGAIQDWHRVTKLGGHIIIVVPHMALYERKMRPPSRRNASHMRFYSPASLLAELEFALPPNSYRIRHFVENDAGYSYDTDPMLPPTGCYEIELVIQKIAPPTWQLEL